MDENGVPILGFDGINDLFFYPNPTTDKIEFSGQIETIRIHNSTGRLVLAKSITKGIRVLDIKKLQPGLLLVQAEANGQLITTKILKK